MSRFIVIRADIPIDILTLEGGHGYSIAIIVTHAVGAEAKASIPINETQEL